MDKLIIEFFAVIIMMIIVLPVSYYTMTSFEPMLGEKKSIGLFIYVLLFPITLLAAYIGMKISRKLFGKK